MAASLSGCVLFPNSRNRNGHFNFLTKALYHWQIFAKVLLLLLSCHVSKFTDQRVPPSPWFAYYRDLCTWREIWELGTSLNLFIKVVGKRAHVNGSRLLVHERQNWSSLSYNQLHATCEPAFWALTIFYKNSLPLCFPAAVWNTLRHNLSSKTMPLFSLSLNWHLKATQRAFGREESQDAGKTNKQTNKQANKKTLLDH